jgi:hypothetical protein
VSEQKYHGENKLPFDDIDDVPLYKAIMLSLICIVLVPCVWLGISLLFDILCRLQANQFLFLTPLCCVVSGEAANNSPYFDLLSNKLVLMIVSLESIASGKYVVQSI